MSRTDVPIPPAPTTCPVLPPRPARCLLTSVMALVMMICLVFVIGCAGHTVDTERARALSELDYPTDAQQGPALDVLVRTDGNTLRLANRTASTYRDMQLWLNGQYVRRVEAIAIGTGNRFALGSFINRFREPFPVGGLLSPEDRRPVVLAELYDPAADVRYPLVVQQENDE